MYRARARFSASDNSVSITPVRMDEGVTFVSETPSSHSEELLDDSSTGSAVVRYRGEPTPSSSPPPVDLQWARENPKTLATAIVLWLSHLCINAAYSILPPFYPLEAKRFNISSVVIGVIIGASPLMVILLTPILRYKINCIGIKFMIVSGTLLVGASYTLMGAMSRVESLVVFVVLSLLLRLVEGVGSAMINTSSFPILYPNTPLTGALEFAASIGLALGPVCGGVLYQWAGGFQTPFFAVGGVILLFVPFLLFLVRGKPSEVEYASFHDSVMFVSNAGVVLILSLTVVIVISGFGFFTPILSPFLRHKLHLNGIEIGLVFSCCYGIHVIFSLLINRLTDRLEKPSCVNGPRLLLVCGLFVTGVAYFFIGPAPFILSNPRLWVTIVAFGVLGAGTALAYDPVYSDMLKASRAMDPVRSTDQISTIISGVITSMLYFGELVGPVIGGGVYHLLKDDFQTSTLVFGELILAQGILLCGVSAVDWCFNRKHR